LNILLVKFLDLSLSLLYHIFSPLSTHSETDEDNIRQSKSKLGPENRLARLKCWLEISKRKAKWPCDTYSSQNKTTFDVLTIPKEQGLVLLREKPIAQDHPALLPEEKPIRQDHTKPRQAI